MSFLRGHEGAMEDEELPPMEGNPVPNAHNVEVLDDAVPTMERWRDCMRAGSQQMQMGEPSRAAAFFRHAAEYRPNHAVTQINLATALLRAGHFHQSLQAYEHVLTLKTYRASALHGRGLALSGLRDWAGALAAFRAAVKYDPQTWAAWLSIADLTPNEAERLYAIHRAAEALEKHCLTTKASPLRHVQCVDALIDAHRYGDAIQWVRTHFPQFPDETIAYECLARVSYRQGAFAEAFRYQQRALQALKPSILPAEPQPNPFAPGVAVEALHGITVLLEAHGLEPFLVAGTLLGFHRNGGPLPHDRDVDIGLMRTAVSPDVVAILRGQPDFRMRRENRPGDRYVAVTYKGISIDLFYYDVTDVAVCGFSGRPGDIQWRFTPFHLAHVEYQGYRCRIPDVPERYLTETYGPHWHHPDTGFASAVSSPALHAVDPYVRAYYAAARAKKALHVGDIVKACALLDQSPIPIMDISNISLLKNIRENYLKFPIHN